MLNGGEAIVSSEQRVRATGTAVPVREGRNLMNAQMAGPDEILDLPFDRLCSQAHLPGAPIGGTSRASCCSDSSLASIFPFHISFGVALASRRRF